MFSQITGSFTTYDSEGITDTTQNFLTDALKDRIIIISSIEYTITGNTDTKILFTNTLSAGGSYQIDFVTRSMLEFYESDFTSATPPTIDRVSDGLIAKKFAVTNEVLSQKIKAFYRNLFALYSSDTNPLARIGNLYEVQSAFIYYMMADVYMDLMLTDEDINYVKRDAYKSKFNDLWKDSVRLLAVDENNNNAIDNGEESRTIGRGKLLSR